MTFDSLDALKNYILSRSQVAIKMAQEKVFKIIEDFLLQYYMEFSPEVYVRTYQLLCSLVKTDIKQTANGWVAEIYYDVSRLDYSVKTLNGIGTWANKNWSEQQTLEAAAHGSHGGWVSGTAIWDDPILVLKKDGINILKQSLIAAGIPVR